MRRLVLLVVLVAALAALPATASAAPGAVQDLPGCSTGSLPPDDDDFSDEVALGFTAEMFDTSFDSIFINKNGNVTIGDPLEEFTPFDFRESGRTMIAPFFADVDTTGDDVGVVRYGQTTYENQAAFCVIWDDVGYYASNTDKRNRFQVIIVDRGDGIDLVFNYDTITWETGDASGGVNGLGGTSAVAGYAAGDGDSAHSLMFPGSFVNGGLLDSNAATSLAGHSTTGQPAGRYVFALRPEPATGVRLTGTITDPGDNPVPGALVQICRQGGTCITRTASGDGVYNASNLENGTYDVTAFAGPEGSFAPARVEDLDIAGDPGDNITQDLQLGELPPPPPDGTTITSIYESDDGLPVAFWDDPLQLETQGCPGGTATYQLVVAGHVARTGALAEGPAGTYRATIAPLNPIHGDGIVTIGIDCPGADPDETIEFGIYIDPSGVVRDTAGRPIEGATVVLLRSADPDGPFFRVPDGSTVMSPANRIHPGSAGPDGRFGWDVVAGYYVVTASKPGCVSAANRSQSAATSAVLTIPPPVTNLDLRLDCTPPAGPGTTTSGGTGGTGGTGAPTVTPPAPRKLAKVGKVKLRKGALIVPIACAAAAKVACAGKVTVKLAGKVVARKGYSKIKAGKTKKLKVKLSKKGRARLAKVKKGKKIKLKVTATVKDAAGKGATAKRTVTVRR
jgi:hypothetical protein